VLSRSPALAFLPGGPTVNEAGRIFAKQFFRHDLTDAMRNEGLSERVPLVGVKP
jgi:hypothetical protein